MALTVGRELSIIIRITYSEIKSPVCVLCHGVKRGQSVVSYQCTIGNMKTQQEAMLRPRVCRDMQGRNKAMYSDSKILFHFI